MSMIEVELLDHMGSDLTVANAARVSFAKHHKSLTTGDVKLIKYLAKHNHWTPFGTSSCNSGSKHPCSSLDSW